MTLAEFQQLYRESVAVKEVEKALETSPAHIHLSGFSGSGDNLLASALFSNKPGNYLFILPDKEEAAYFFNGLENLHPNERGNTLLYYPASYKRPYQIEDIDNANVMQRAETLSTIHKHRKNIVVVTYPEAILEKVVTKKQLQSHTFEIQVGKTYTLEFLNDLFLEYEFLKVDYVYEPGQFAVRGGIIDIFSFSSDTPFRIEFFGDEAESIRAFDPTTQLSIKTLKQISVVPNIQKKLLKESREHFLEFIPDNCTIWIKDTDYAVKKITEGLEKAQYAYEKLQSEIRHLTPEELYSTPEEFTALLQQFKLVEVGGEPLKTPTFSLKVNQSPQPAFNKNFEMLGQNLKDNYGRGYKPFILAENPKQIERLDAIFRDTDQEVKFTPIILGIKEGFIDHDNKRVCYTDHQIFERYHRFKLKESYAKSQQAITIKEIQNLQKGDYVVHIDHGVGQFSGLEKIEVNGKTQEAIRLIYQGNDLLYVSIHSLHKISRYTGKEGTEPKMNKLGSPVWATAKAKTKSKVKEIAYDLIQLYAKRKASKGFAFSPDTYFQTELEASFIYEDTPDQLKSTTDVKKDMESEVPMDRLVCGDVGFGKTEIAIRAAFKAATDGKQVAVLAPTTILTFQHFKTFSDRLKGFPVKVDYVNRFKSSKKIKEALKKLDSGETDIIIGTHRLVGKDVKFKDLGLMIIDEEQKFGVAVKDKLKTIKENIDTLTLTATPIPRTLQFSLMGARDLSIINTPPPNRYPVQTEVHTFNEEIIRDAIMYEVQRGGQVFFVNNRIQNIQEVAGMLQRLCPDVRIAIGHGQMEGEKLEAIMLDFMEGMYDVLLATSIIESGIDVPNANTIIINNANNFGLSDLHQLRGRVGRSNKKAFCILIVPPVHMLTTEARKRLHAIEQFSELGSGFNIAMRDLDIRGAGNMLGGEQSGFISDIGFEMYQKILDEAIQELRENEFKTLFADEEQKGDFVKECQLETDLQLILPDEYVNQIAERLSLYKELDDIETEEELRQFEEKLRDRFGPIPEETQELMNAVRLRKLAKEIGVEKLIIKNDSMIGTFIQNENSPYYQSAKFTQVLNYIQSSPRGVKMSEKNNKLRLIYDEVKSVGGALERLREIVGK